MNELTAIMDWHLGFPEIAGITGIIIILATIFFMQRRVSYYLDYMLRKSGIDRPQYFTVKEKIEQIKKESIERLCLLSKIRICLHLRLKNMNHPSVIRFTFSSFLIMSKSVLST